MASLEIFERSPMRAFEQSIHGGPAIGELAAVVGRAGTGKSAMLVHVALDHLVRDEKVLHVSLREGADDVRTYYNEIFESVARVARLAGRDKHELAIEIERNRQIQCYLERSFGVEDLRRALNFTEEVMHFTPAVVVLDGFEPSDPAQLETLAALAKERGFTVWAAIRSHRDQADSALLSASWTTVVALEPLDRVIELRALKAGGEVVSEPTGLQLEPSTMLITGEDTWDPMSAPPSPQPEQCTLYSGGAPGAESAFGEMAEGYNIAEVNFTFDGHKQARVRGRQMLDDRELAAGDVSLVYVSKRLKRTYSEGAMIRKILQSLWHQVSRAQQVFVVGAIQEDGTVTGGTGWSVELARMWHKNLWVYDQDQEGWFHWARDRWIAGVPVIESPHFCGTGTRYLTDSGRRAVQNLFDRSFGDAEG